MSTRGVDSRMSRSHTLTKFTRTPIKPTDELLNLPPDFLKTITHKVKKLDKSQSGYELTFETPAKQPMVVIVPPFEKKKKLNAFLLLNNQVIGEGAGGAVFKALDLFKNEIVACKLTKHFDNSVENLTVEREQRNLGLVEDRLLGTFQKIDGDLIYDYTFMVYYKGYSLLEHLYETQVIPAKDKEKAKKVFLNKRKLDFTHAVNLCISIMEEVLLVHFCGLVYRDLKTDNFVIAQSNHPDIFKLVGIDLGSALTFAEAAKNKTLDGTSHGYVAPELMQAKNLKSGYTRQQDYFSLAVVMAEVLTEENFQVKLGQFLEHVAQDGFQRELTSDEIKSLMPDVFFEKDIAALRTKFEQTQERTTAALIRFELVNLIYQCFAKPREETQTTATATTTTTATTAASPSDSATVPMATTDHVDVRPSEEDLIKQLERIKHLRSKLIIEKRSGNLKDETTKLYESYCHNRKAEVKTPLLNDELDAPNDKAMVLEDENIPKAKKKKKKKHVPTFEETEDALLKLKEVFNRLSLEDQKPTEDAIDVINSQAASPLLIQAQGNVSTQHLTPVQSKADSISENTPRGSM